MSPPRRPPQREQLAHQLQRGVGAGLREAAQADRGLVQEAVGDRAGERLDAHEVARRGGLPAAVVLGQHLRHDRVAVLAQRADGRQRIELAEPAGEAADLLLDDLLRSRNLTRAGVEVARYHLLEIVDVV